MKALAAVLVVVAAGLALVVAAGGESHAGGPGPPVVTVLVDRPSGVPERATGFVAAPGRIVTVAHVLDGGGAVRVATPGGSRGRARVLELDRAADLALLAAPTPPGRGAAEGGGPPAAPVAAKGGPPAAGTHLVSARGAQPVAVRRRVRARVRDSAGPRIYSRATLELAGAVSAGDSGAPVLDDGELLGVVFARSRRHEDTAYAVDASAVDRLLDR
jgi:S1-C subfamily serine protease